MTYGARTVVWQGSVGNRCPYADQTPLPSMWSPGTARFRLRDLLGASNDPLPWPHLWA